MFGFVIGYVAWHVFSTGESTFDLTKLAAFVGVLLGAVVLSAFPAQTVLFSSYAIGLGLGFFFSPIFRAIRMGISYIALEMNLTFSPDHGSFEEQQRYIEEKWKEVERVIDANLQLSNGRVEMSDLLSLPLDDSGKIAAMKKYARLHPERSRVQQSLTGVRLYKRSISIAPPTDANEA